MYNPNVENTVVVQNRKVTSSELISIRFEKQVFRNCEFADCLITQITISECEFISCTFDKVTFEKSWLKDCTFQDCNFMKTYFIDGGIYSASLLDSNFDECDFICVQIQYLDCSDVVSKNVKFQNVDIFDSSWINSNFVVFSMDGCHLKNTIQNECNFQSSRIVNSNAEQWIISKSHIESTKWEKLNLSGFNLGDSVLSSNQFSDTQIDAFILTGTQMDSCVFSNVNMINCVANDANLSTCRFDRVSCEASYWKGAKFIKCVFETVYAPGAVFSEISVDQTTLYGSLCGAELINTPSSFYIFADTVDAIFSSARQDASRLWERRTQPGRNNYAKPAI